jgi:hypothetical protein
MFELLLSAVPFMLIGPTKLPIEYGDILLRKNASPDTKYILIKSL